MDALSALCSGELLHLDHPCFPMLGSTTSMEGEDFMVDSEQVVGREGQQGSLGSWQVPTGRQERRREGGRGERHGEDDEAADGGGGTRGGG